MLDRTCLFPDHLRCGRCCVSYWLPVSVFSKNFKQSINQIEGESLPSESSSVLIFVLTNNNCRQMFVHSNKNNNKTPQASLMTTTTTWHDATRQHAWWRRRRRRLHQQHDDQHKTDQDQRWNSIMSCGRKEKDIIRRYETNQEQINQPCRLTCFLFVSDYNTTHSTRRRVSNTMSCGRRCRSKIKDHSREILSFNFSAYVTVFRKPGQATRITNCHQL